MRQNTSKVAPSNRG